jgi:hypothetical protein
MRRRAVVKYSNEDIVIHTTLFSSLSSGGKLAVEFSSWPVVAVVGSSAFVHAGITPEIARDADAINAHAGAWLRGERNVPPMLLTAPGRRSPIWTRHLSSPPDINLGKPACAELGEALELLGVKRLVVGHTPQEEIICACGSVWRIDLGMSRAMGGGRVEALEIVGDQVRADVKKGFAPPTPPTRTLSCPTLWVTRRSRATKKGLLPEPRKA